MDVLTRNYFQMLRNGAFGENGPLEPMSKFKWNALYQRAECDEVSMYLKEDAPNVSINFEDHKQGRKFRNIAKTEYHAIDTSLDTLDMLNIMLYNIDQTLSGHTSLHGIIEMGRFLRKKGDKVDFLKLEGWFRKLGVNNMAQLHGSILISLFGFQLDEPAKRRWQRHWANATADSHSPTSPTTRFPPHTACFAGSTMPSRRLRNK